MDKNANRNKVIGAVIVLVFVAGIAYFFWTSDSGVKGEIPSYVTGEMREVYEYAKTPEGKVLLEQLPCYCGCKYEGHLHSRHCFWRDDGTFDKHGITCSTCLDIAKKAKAMQAQGIGVCDIRSTIDAFYLPNKHLATPTPLPAGCTAANLTASIMPGDPSVLSCSGETGQGCSAS